LTLCKPFDIVAIDKWLIVKAFCFVHGQNEAMIKTPTEDQLHAASYHHIPADQAYRINIPKRAAYMQYLATPECRLCYWLDDYYLSGLVQKQKDYMPIGYCR
jgi:hypothetical protein